MQFTFTTDSAAEAAAILEALGGKTTAANTDDNKEEFWGEADTASTDIVPDDPWAEPSTTEATTKSLPSDVPTSRTHKVETKNGERFFTFGLPKAPDCECGFTAALTAPQPRPPFTWSKWVCPVKFSKDYKNACAFSDWGPKK